MRADLTDLLRSPCCHVELRLEAPRSDRGEIWDGRLICSHCGAGYLILRGMPQLFLDDERWQPKAREAEGWVTYHKNLGIYDVVEDAVDLHIPFYPEEPWIGVARSWDVGLRLVGLTGSETILDLGAGRGWAARHFAALGCRVVALDVVADDNVGLGRGKALMEHAGVFFDRLIADGENLPFADGSFDLVFCAAALHHSSHLPQLMQQVARVLRPGGRLLALREPCISIVDDEAATLAQVAADEMDVGINETRPNLIDYANALDGAGLRVLRAVSPDTYGMDDRELIALSRHWGALRPPLSVRHLRDSLGRQRGHWRLRRRAAEQGRYWSGRRVLQPFAGRARLELAHLLWCGGELILLAEKPA